MPNTHVYGLIGDGHLRGKNSPGPGIYDPIKGMSFTIFGATVVPNRNSIVVGGTSGAKARVVAENHSGSGPYTVNLTLETINLLAFREGETVTYDCVGGPGTASLGIIAGGTREPVLNQLLGDVYDAELTSMTPAGAVDNIWWDRFCKVASTISTSAFMGTFAAGDRITTSGGGGFTIWTVGAAGGGQLLFTVLRKTGSIANGQTFTGPTGSGTINVVQADTTQGNWIPHSYLPNLGGTGTYFEQIPGGSGSIDSVSLGIEKPFLEAAFAKHSHATDPSDRGSRFIPYVTFDDTTSGAIGGVTLLAVPCSGLTGTFAAGETVTGPGGWSAKVHFYVTSLNRLYVYDTNDAILTTGTITGGTSGATATATSTCFGWSKGSLYFQNFLAQVAAALGAPGALYLGQAVKWEGLFLMIWETEFQPVHNSLGTPWPTFDMQKRAFVKWIADLRSALGRSDLPVTLFRGDQRQHANDISFLGVPFSVQYRDLILAISTLVDKCTITSGDGGQGAQQAGLPYPSSFLYWRTLDYVEFGRRAWRSLEFAQTEIPAGNFAPLPIILLAGQSQAVASIPFAVSIFDRDPDLYSTAGITLDPKKWMWNDDGKVWQNYDAALNGNTFLGLGAGTFGPECSLLRRQEFRFGTASVPGEIGCIKLALGGSACYAGAHAAYTWDPTAPGRTVTTTSMTVTAFAASPPLVPQRGRFTAAPGTFSSATWAVGMPVSVSGSLLGFLGGGGNNTTPYATVSVHAIATDRSWVELAGAFVNEAAATFTLQVGAIPLMPLADASIRSAFDACVEQLRRIPRPTLIVWWNGESDLETYQFYKDALRRVLDHFELVFGQKLKGEVRTATVIMQLTSRTPWQVSDEAVAAVRTAQAQVAVEIGNATAVSTDQLPLEMASPPVWPRTQRSHNGVHHTMRGFVQAGYLMDKGSDGLTGIPDFPDPTNVDFFADGATTAGGSGGGADTGMPRLGKDFDDLVPAADATGGGGATGDSVSSGGATDSEESPGDSVLDEIDRDGIEIAGYTVNRDGRTVQMRSLRELIALDEYETTKEVRARGPTRTRASFN